MKKILSVVLAIVATVSTAVAQQTETTLKAFGQWELGVTAGTTGVGLEVSAPVSNLVGVRAGFDFMPRFHHNMSFEIQVGDTPESKYDSQGNRVETKFDRLAAKLESMTGYEVDDVINMVGRPTYYNAKLLVDLKPFRNKNWYVTGGVYIGPSKVADAYNTTEDMPSLMAVGMYNHLWERVANSNIINDPDFMLLHSTGEILSEIQLLSDLGFDPATMFGSQLAVNVDNIDNAVLETYQKIYNYGRMGIHVGDFKDGSPYMMEPDANSMVKAKIKVNSFKPYLGFGYGGRLIPNDDRYRVKFDCGLLFWGGTPSIVTHDGTDLAKEVRNIRRSVGDYVDIIKVFKVFPVINIGITRQF